MIRGCKRVAVLHNDPSDQGVLLRLRTTNDQFENAEPESPARFGKRHFGERRVPDLLRLRERIPLLRSELVGVPAGTIQMF